LNDNNFRLGQLEEKVEAKHVISPDDTKIHLVMTACFRSVLPQIFILHFPSLTICRYIHNTWLGGSLEDTDVVQSYDEHNYARLCNCAYIIMDLDTRGAATSFRTLKGRGIREKYDHLHSKLYRDFCSNTVFGNIPTKTVAFVGICVLD
jgi:hypothetical protein